MSTKAASQVAIQSQYIHNVKEPGLIQCGVWEGSPRQMCEAMNTNDSTHNTATTNSAARCCMSQNKRSRQTDKLAEKRTNNTQHVYCLTTWNKVQTTEHASNCKWPQTAERKTLLATSYSFAYHLQPVRHHYHQQHHTQLPCCAVAHHCQESAQ